MGYAIKEVGGLSQGGEFLAIDFAYGNFKRIKRYLFYAS